MVEFKSNKDTTYRVYANKTQELINARKFAFWDFSKCVGSDDLSHAKVKIVIIFVACVHKHGNLFMRPQLQTRSFPIPCFH